jgi:hypothetical protein
MTDETKVQPATDAEIEQMRDDYGHFGRPEPSTIRRDVLSLIARIESDRAKIEASERFVMPTSDRCVCPPEDHCEHFNDWPMHAPDGDPEGDPGDGLGVPGVCCECGALQPMPDERPHCPCYFATEGDPDTLNDAGYCCGCDATRITSDEGCAKEKV